VALPHLLIEFPVRLGYATATTLPGYLITVEVIISFSLIIIIIIIINFFFFSFTTPTTLSTFLLFFSDANILVKITLFNISLTVANAVLQQFFQKGKNFIDRM
jgi:hypothetical protein